MVKRKSWEWNDVHGLGEDAGGWVKMPLSVLGRRDLSAKAKVLFAYMNSKPVGYQFASKRIAEDFKEGYKSVRGAMLELEGAGYMTRQKLGDGRMVYELRENYWSLTEDEAKVLLLETFDDAFRPAVEEYSKVDFDDVREGVRGVGVVGEQVDALALEFFRLCVDAKLPMNEHVLGKWLKHVSG